MKFSIAALSLALISLALGAPSTVTAAPMVSGTVIVESLAPSAGTFLTPIWIAFHDGSFDIYDQGMAASPGLESLAEDGATMAISGEFDAANNPGSIFDATINTIGPIAPGAKVEFPFELPASSMTDTIYFSYASMVIPSNDAFIANGDERAHLVFSEDTCFTDLDFTVMGAEVLDAGTEVNDEVPENVAFMLQRGPNVGDTERGTVQIHDGFQMNLPLPNGILNYGPTSGGNFKAYTDGVVRIRVIFESTGKKGACKGTKAGKNDRRTLRENHKPKGASKRGRIVN